MPCDRVRRIAETLEWDWLPLSLRKTNKESECIKKLSETGAQAHARSHNIQPASYVLRLWVCVCAALIIQLLSTCAILQGHSKARFGRLSTIILAAVLSEIQSRERERSKTLCWKRPAIKSYRPHICDYSMNHAQSHFSKFTPVRAWRETSRHRVARANNRHHH